MLRQPQEPVNPLAAGIEALQRKNRQLLEELKRERRIRRALELTVETLQQRNGR